jgi:hypothetical protein
MFALAFRLSLCAVGFTLLTGSTTADQTRDDSLARLGAYVDAWEHELGSVVADETYRQVVTRLPRSGSVRQPNLAPRQVRELVSEFTLIHFADGHSDWLGHRAVRLVDGKAVVAPGPSLNTLLSDATLSWPERWRRVRDANAAFNIGPIVRDSNLPTFALAALRTTSHARFTYGTPRSDTVDGVALTRRDFRERARPTLVAGEGGRDVPLEGTVWLAGPGGQVRRTEILLRDRAPQPATGGREEDRVREETLTSRLTVTFGPDPNVGVWVPIDMRERHDNSWGETTTGHAQYGRYRRFLTTARLVRPGP